MNAYYTHVTITIKIWNIFFTLQSSLKFLCNFSPMQPLRWFLSFYISYVRFKNSYKWNHTASSVLCLVSFLIPGNHFLRVSRVVACVDLLFHYYWVCLYMDLFMHLLLMNIWALSFWGYFEQSYSEHLHIYLLGDIQYHWFWGNT